MTKIRFETGQVVNFDGNPTQQDIEEVSIKLGIGRKPAEEKKEPSRIEQFSKGVARGVLSTGYGLGQLGTSIGRAVLPKALEPKQKNIYEGERPDILEAKTPWEKAGKFTEQVAEFAVPATKVSKLTKGAGFLSRTGARAATSGAVATAQEGKIGTGTGIAAGTEIALPVVGKTIAKPALNIMRRLFRGVGSGLSGVSGNVIDTIVENPMKSVQISKQLKNSGSFGVLEKNAKDIVNGVSKIRQEAGQAYGKSIQTLKTTDINPTVFRTNVQKFLDSVGSSVKGKFRTLDNVEFTEPKNIKRASNLIDDISTTKLDGFSLNKLLKKIKDARYKIATSDERLSFNAFLSDMESTVKDTLSKSTGKLDDINKAYSSDMQIVDGIEQIFGKVKFKNIKEINNAARKLEALFSKKGLDPRLIDNFLTRIGIEPSGFRTTEAVRQISEKTIGGANRVGGSVSELTQSVSGAIITPNAVKNISIATGIAENILSQTLSKLSPTLRAALVKSILEINTNR